MSDAAIETHISSFVVHCRPTTLRNTCLAIDKLQGAETHHPEASGKLVVLLENDDEQSLLDTIAAIEAIDGVLSASLVYHHIDSANETGNTP